MKKCLAFLPFLLVYLAAFTQVSFAANGDNVKIALNNAYYKSDGTYTVVVKENPDAKLALYINDKNPVYATVNKQNWVTFRKIKLTNNSKISFTKVFSNKGKTTQKPINYVRYVSMANTAVVFLAGNPAKPQATQPTPATQVTDSPAPTPTPQPSCTNGTYVNSAGNTVCRPEAANTTPSGATAVCRDGTYSFSQTHSGTCSHHGGVSEWL